MKASYSVRKILTLASVVLLLLSLTFLAKAQDQSIIDSLKSIVETAEHLPDRQASDTLVCDAYSKWGKQVYSSKADSALVLWQKAHALAEEHLANEPPPSLKKTYSTLLSVALNNIGYFYMIQGDIPEALKNHNRSLKIREEIGDKKGEAISLHNIGYIYKNQGDIEKGLEYYIKSLKIREEIGDQEGVGYSLNNIGNVYENQGDLQTGLEYYQKSLKIREEIGDRRGAAESVHNIGNIYKLQGDTQKALAYFLKSLKIKEEIGDQRGAAISHLHIGSALCDLDSIDEGIRAMKRGLGIFEAIHDKQWMGYAVESMSHWYLKSNLIDSAEHYANWAMKIAKELNYPLNIQRTADRLSQVYRKQKKFKQALELYELHIQMRDSIRNEETQKATIRQQTKYEFEKAQLIQEQEEKEKARLDAEATGRRDNLQYSIVLICLLVIGGLVAVLGRLSLPEKIAEGFIFFAFLLFFEFVLVLADPYIEGWTGGAPGWKLLINAGVAALIFPLHAFFETMLKRRLTK